MDQIFFSEVLLVLIKCYEHQSHKMQHQFECISDHFSKIDSCEVLCFVIHSLGEGREGNVLWENKYSRAVEIKELISSLR